MSASIVMAAPLPAVTFPFCPWCGVPTLVHEPPVEQVTFGFPLLICPHAPVGEIVAAGPKPWEET